MQGLELFGYGLIGGSVITAIVSMKLLGGTESAERLFKLERNMDALFILLDTHRDFMDESEVECVYEEATERAKRECEWGNPKFLPDADYDRSEFIKR